MTLSHDTARCNGQFNPVPFGVELQTTCIDCLRRTCKSIGERTSYFQGVVSMGVCLNKIDGEKQ